MRDLRHHIERIRALEQEGVDNRNRERVLRQRWRDRGRENERDEQIYKQFTENAKKGEKENNNRFRLSYINELPIKWNILICLGKKNIGKSWNIHRLIDECIKENREIVMVRATAKEFQSALVHFFDDATSRVRVQFRNSGCADLVLKPTTVEEFNKRHKMRKIGFCANLSGLTSYQGSSFAKVKYIIWDECISDGSTQKISNQQIASFERFISSVVRDKKDVKVYIFGNLLSKVELHSGDPLLNYYGIDPSCGCKYIPAKAAHEANILFINCKDLFKGIEDQGVLGGVDDATSRNLLTNELDEYGIKIVNDYAFLTARVLYSLVFSYNLVDIAIHIREVKIEGYPKYLIINIKNFLIGDVFTSGDGITRIYTNEEAISNSYSQCVTYLDKDEFDSLVEELLDHLAANRVLYANNSSQAQIMKYARHLKQSLIKRPNPFGKAFLSC